MNKRGGFTDIFLFMIIAIILVFICAIFIYLGGKVNTEFHNQLDDKMFGTLNGSQVVDDTLGKVNQSYQSLYWISIMLIVGMILSIFIGSYLVTTSPVYFFPYFLVVIIAIIVSVGLNQAYEQVILTPELASTFEGFVGANFILGNLPVWVTIISFVGAIIMFVRMGSRDRQIYGGSY